MPQACSEGGSGGGGLNPAESSPGLLPVCRGGEGGPRSWSSRSFACRRGVGRPWGRDEAGWDWAQRTGPRRAGPSGWLVCHPGQVTGALGGASSVEATLGAEGRPSSGEARPGRWIRAGPSPPPSTSSSGRRATLAGGQTGLLEPGAACTVLLSLCLRSSQAAVKAAEAVTRGPGGCCPSWDPWERGGWLSPGPSTRRQESGGRQGLSRTPHPGGVLCFVDGEGDGPRTGSGPWGPLRPPRPRGTDALAVVVAARLGALRKRRPSGPWSRLAPSGQGT